MQLVDSLQHRLTGARGAGHPALVLVLATAGWGGSSASRPNHDARWCSRPPRAPLLRRAGAPVELVAVEVPQAVPRPPVERPVWGFRQPPAPPPMDDDVKRAEAAVLLQERCAGMHHRRRRPRRACAHNGTLACTCV
jgi:hypothetical protein